jgi:hypothetical protein
MRVIGQVKRAQRKPVEGVYYVVPLKTGIDEVWAETKREVVDPWHFDFWTREVAPALGEMYGLDADTVSKIRTAYTGLPRGRVVRKDNKWIIAHGGDTPDAVKHKVKSGFGLFGVEAEWILDEHEKMDSTDAKIVSDALKLNE